MAGVNIDETVKLARACGLPVIASGGVTNMDDIAALKPYDEYLLGAITGRAIYEGTLDLAATQAFLDA